MTDRTQPPPRPSRSWLLVGCLALAGVGLYAYGGPGKLIAYSDSTPHKDTARSLIEGRLTLLRDLLGVSHDQQIYNGAAYTNWGYGVPFLQAPFQALSAWSFDAYFPDRLIFFMYFLALLPLLLSTFRRVLEVEPVVACIFALGALTHGLFELMAHRFIVYEETIAYFVLAQLAALCCFLRWEAGRERKWLYGLGAAAGIAWLIRSTGLAYFSMWCALVLLRDRLAWLRVAAAASPAALLWAWTNRMRTGGWLSAGMQNSNPDSNAIAMVRFGSTCANTPERLFDLAGTFGKLFFIGRPEQSPLMRSCGFLGFELRNAVGPEAYFGPGVLIFLIASLVFLLWRRHRLLSALLPYGLMTALFFAFVRWGMGFDWRYVGDFWPALILIAVEVMRRLPASRVRWAVAAFVLLDASVVLAGRITKTRAHLGVLPLEKAKALAERRQKLLTTPQPAVASVRQPSGERYRWLYADGYGWQSDGRTWPYSSFYLGVPGSDARTYTLHLTAEGDLPAELTVYCNGALYPARRVSDGFEASVPLDPSKMKSPVVLATVQWAQWPTPVSIRLLQAELR